MKGKVTKEILEQMKSDRFAGLTYSQIEQKYNVGRWVTIHYLKGIELQEGVAVELWKQAETIAIDLLTKKGFHHFINLNEICPTCYFDIYAEKEKDRWLIDVTINESKDIVAKSMRLVEGYRCAILYVDKGLKESMLVELKKVE